MNNFDHDAHIQPPDELPEWYQMFCPTCQKPVDVLIIPFSGEAKAVENVWLSHMELSPECPSEKLDFVFGGFYSYKFKGGELFYPLRDDKELRTDTQLTPDRLDKSQWDKLKRFQG